MNPMLKIVIGTAAGALVGFLSYRFIGCKTGACPLNSNPWVSMAVWGLIGFLVSSGR